MVGEGPYREAAYLPKLQKTGVMVLTDLDGTLTSGEGLPSNLELSDRAAVRRLLLNEGVVAGAVTARTCGLTLSEADYQASPELKGLELPPHWGLDEDGQHVYADPASIDHFNHCLGWDLTAGLGSYIIIRNGAGYRVDRGWEHLLQFEHVQGRSITEEDLPWREAMLILLSDCPGAYKHMLPIESHQNYLRGITNVAPLPFRFQLQFKGEEGLRRMREIEYFLRERAADGDPLALRVQTVDESRVASDPQKSVYLLYLIPWSGSKEKMIHRVVSQSILAAGMRAKDVRLFYAGDTLTDLRAGLWAGGDARLVFLLAKGSRIAPYLIERKDAYGTEDLSFLWSEPTKPGRSKSRLVPTGRRGEYEFVHKIRGRRKNLVIIADERYPRERTAPGSVAAFLEEYLVERKRRP